MTAAVTARPLFDEADTIDRPTAKPPVPQVEPKIGRTMVASIAWTTLVMLVATGAPMWWLTGDIWNGIGLGAFCAFWGGPGFGTMAGGVIWTMRQERNEAAAHGSEG